MQTDCPLVGGDSGGPLLDLDGKLIGINSRIGGPTDMNLHVPIDVFQPIGIGSSRARRGKPAFPAATAQDVKKCFPARGGRREPVRGPREMRRATTPPWARSSAPTAGF